MIIRFSVWRRGAEAALLLVGLLLIAAEVQAGQSPTPPLFTEETSGKEIYAAACAACHGEDGTGHPRSLVGFEPELPDFTDCRFATAEPMADWLAVVHEGGPVRALDRHMPAFADALTASEMRRVVSYLYSFCSDTAWPRGDLNLPRPYFTEKAYPENELVVEMASEADASGFAVQYERRIGARAQVEATVPIEFLRDSNGWHSGAGDFSLGLKRVMHASADTGRIFSVAAELVVPTGRRSAGIGDGVVMVEPAVMFGQALGATGFVQLHAGVELSLDRERRGHEGFARVAGGFSLLEDRGFGRAWTPMVEVLWARAEAAPSELDVSPQIQVTLSKLQHVAVSAGLRIPLTERRVRSAQFVTYFLWDWFDGGLFEFWR